MTSAQDKIFMQRALKLAAKGQGRVAPNPLVGCVIVKNGKILAEGYHKKFGGPHAEIEALKKIRFLARGATLYVTLEPCHHHGKTPPCLDAVLRAGIKRVVIATPDPNPLTAGRSIRKLRARGVVVTVGVGRTDALALNRGYFKWIQTGLPVVIAKFAQSIDGKITAHRGKRMQISGPESQRYVQEFRKTVDAICVGRKTVLIDNPLLNVRQKTAPQPKRVILDSRLRLNPNAKIFKSHGGEVILATALTDASPRVQAWRRRGVCVLCLPDADGRVDFLKLLRLLPEHGILTLFVEGGAEVLDSLAALQCVDEWQILVSPKIFGQAGVPALISPKFFKKRVRQKIKLGEDLLLKL